MSRTQQRLPGFPSKCLRRTRVLPAPGLATGPLWRTSLRCPRTSLLGVALIRRRRLTQPLASQTCEEEQRGDDIKSNASTYSWVSVRMPKKSSRASSSKASYKVTVEDGVATGGDFGFGSLLAFPGIVDLPGTLCRIQSIMTGILQFLFFSGLGWVCRAIGVLVGRWLAF